MNQKVFQMPPEPIDPGGAMVYSGSKLKLISEKMEIFLKKAEYLISIVLPTVELLSALGHQNEDKRHPVHHLCRHIQIFQEQTSAYDPTPARKMYLTV